jgi:hypothetical protein
MALRHHAFLYLSATLHGFYAFAFTLGKYYSRRFFFNNINSTPSYMQKKIKNHSLVYGVADENDKNNHVFIPAVRGYGTRSYLFIYGCSS